MDVQPAWKRIVECRHLLLGVDAIGYRDLFDEFVEHHEFGLALETVCDYLVEEQRQVDGPLIARMQLLHQAMNVTDDCVQRLEVAMIGTNREA